MIRPPPELFYTGIVAQAYGPLRSSPPDPRIYAGFVKSTGQPALELGCGDGDPLLDLVAGGLDVEGLDSSPDMVARCRAAAASRGLDVVVHEQPMQSMDLGRRYPSIYLAGPTFNLLPDDDTAGRALERIAAHLAPGGAALVPLFVPPVTPPEHLGVVRSYTDDHGTTFRFAALHEARDDEARTLVTTTRYEADHDGDVVVEERPWVVHWHTQPGFGALAERAGLTVTAVVAPDGTRAEADAPVFAFILTPATGDAER